MHVREREEDVMPAVPWRRCGAAGDGDVAVVMASRFRVRRYRDVPRFLVDSLRVHRQVLAAGRAVGVSLRARPLRRDFLTLSAWRDRGAVHRLVVEEPHATVMRRYAAATEESTFAFFEARVIELPLSWTEVGRRLDAERERRRARTSDAPAGERSA
jgi:hypothetical protein